MTPEQADNLLELLAAANVLNRLDDNAPDVWAAALADLDYRDCMTAAAHLIRTERWVKIADIRDAVRRMRNERIATANLLHEPQPDETPIDFIARRRAQLAAAGDGDIPATTVRQALKGGPHPAVAKAIEGAFQAVPPTPVDNPPYVPSMARQVIADTLPRWADRYQRWPELAIACPNPTCRALPRRACKRPSGKELREHTHPARRDAWAARTEAPDAS